MYIVTVIPLKRGLQKENLSYFSSQDIQLGSIVTVQIRLKDVNAIVIDKEPVRNLKSDLRSADFKIKKVSEVKGSSPFDSDFFLACQIMKDYTAGKMSDVIKNLFPSVLLDNLEKINYPTVFELKNEAEESPNIKHEKLIFQNLTEDRISWYRTLIRESFAKKESVFLCVPTILDIEKFKNELTKGIENYVYTFHGNMNDKVFVNSWNDIISEPHPVLVIGTGIWLAMPRNDIKTVILEKESSDTYKQIIRPYVDIRTFAEVFTSIKKTRLILGDSLLRPETLHRHEIGEFDEIAPPTFRLAQALNQTVVDMKDESENKKNKFTVLSQKVKDLITRGIENNESVFLFSVRKGLAGITVCNDCGHTLLCPLCKTPVVLYGSKQEQATKSVTSRVFMCNKCGRKEKTETSCPKCGSWNLTPLGIGTDRVHEETAKFFPNTKIFQIDKENTKTEKQAKDKIKQFEKSNGGVLIGTEMALSYLGAKVKHSAIISLDGLLSIPSFNMTQKILHTVERLNENTEKNLIIQTRTPENQTLENILNGNILPLYREDLKERERFGYPPFKRLIKITFAGTAKETERAREFIDANLGKYDPQIFSAFVNKNKGRYITNTVIKTDPKAWRAVLDIKNDIDKDLSRILANLPPAFSVNVDPTDLL